MQREDELESLGDHSSRVSIQRAYIDDENAPSAPLYSTSDTIDVDRMKRFVKTPWWVIEWLLTAH
eukprot:6206150-Pleurochrysis_carterae.AAC.1